MAQTIRARDCGRSRVSRSRPNATHTTLSPVAPTSRRIWALRTFSKSSQVWPATPSVTRKQPGCSAQQTGIRQRTGEVRLPIYQAGYDASVQALRNAMDANEFEAAWAEGAALSTDEAIAYAQRGRGERKRPSSGWASLTPAELDVVRLVSEGLGNKDIAARLFVSPRTVQSHLTRVYTKLGLSSRVQLAQEAARRSTPTNS